MEIFGSSVSNDNSTDLLPSPRSLSIGYTLPQLTPSSPNIGMKGTKTFISKSYLDTQCSDNIHTPVIHTCTISRWIQPHQVPHVRVGGFRGVRVGPAGPAFAGSIISRAQQNLLK